MGLMSWLRERYHRSPIHRHKFETFCDGLKRKCVCGHEEWVFENRCPSIGEPQYEWKMVWPATAIQVSQWPDKPERLDGRD
jgi:hypothetical protein